jgi:hypothetical protein
MTTIAGRNVKVQVALTFAAAILPTAVTKALPAVATLTAHGKSDGSVGYWAVTAGMVEMDGQAVMIDNVAANTMELSGLDTTGYSTYVDGTGSLILGATWGTLSEAAGYTVGGGAANQLDDTRLLDTKTRNVAGMLAPQDLAIDVKNQEVDTAAMAFVEAAARNGTAILIKITRGAQVLRVAYGVPSIAGEAVQAGALASGQFNVICPGWVLKPNAV